MAGVQACALSICGMGVLLRKAKEKTAYDKPWESEVLVTGRSEERGGGSECGAGGSPNH